MSAIENSSLNHTAAPTTLDESLVLEGLTKKRVQSGTPRAASKRKLWTGRVMSALPVLFLIFDSIVKFTKIAPVVEANTQLGYPMSVAAGIGILELAGIFVYIIPSTSVFGALLLTGYLGGAVASHVRVGNPLLTHVLFPVYVGGLLWAGLYLREDRLRALLPLRK